MPYAVMSNPALEQQSAILFTAIIHTDLYRNGQQKRRQLLETNFLRSQQFLNQSTSPRILLNKVHYRAHNSPPLVHILKETKPVPVPLLFLGDPFQHHPHTYAQVIRPHHQNPVCIPSLWRLVLQRSISLELRPLGFVVDNMTLGQVFSEYIGFHLSASSQQFSMFNFQRN